MSIVLLTSIIFITMVYSAFSTKLQIGGDLIVRSDNDIRVTNLSIKESINGAYETYNSKYTKDSTSMFLTLPSNSSITYEVVITNKSDNTYTLSSLNELTSLNSNLSYVIDTEQYDIYDSNNIRKITITISNNSSEKIYSSLILEYKFDIAYSMFIDGRSFNVKIKTLAGNTDATYESNDTNITSIVRSDTLSADVKEDNIISTSDSTVPIYVWYDGGTIYYYTKYDRPLMNYDGSYMFSFLTSANSLDLETIDTSNTISMMGMFFNCSADILDVSSFDTSKVISMSYMFIKTNATEIKGLDILNTSSVTNMSNMFAYAQTKELDLSGFSTSRVTDMSNMFYYSSAKEIKGIDKFNTSNVSNMGGMFYNANVSKINLSSFDTSNVTNMSTMFTNSKLLQIDGLENFNTSKVGSMWFMLYGIGVNELDLSSFDTSNVTNMSYMLGGNSNLTTIYVSNKFDTNNVTNSAYMFTLSSNLIGGNGTKYDSSHIDKEYARVDTEDTPGYFTLKEN